MSSRLPRCYACCWACICCCIRARCCYWFCSEKMLRDGSAIPTCICGMPMLPVVPPLPLFQLVSCFAFFLLGRLDLHIALRLAATRCSAEGDANASHGTIALHTLKNPMVMHFTTRFAAACEPPAVAAAAVVAAAALEPTEATSTVEALWAGQAASDSGEARHCCSSCCYCCSLPQEPPALAAAAALVVRRWPFGSASQAGTACAGCSASANFACGALECLRSGLARSGSDQGTGPPCCWR